MKNQKEGRGRRDEPEQTPAEPTPPANPAPPAPAPKRHSDAIPDDVEKLVGWAAVGTALWGFFQGKHGSKAAMGMIREGFGWIQQGFKIVADETGKSGELCDQASDIAYRGTKTQIRRLRQDRRFRARINGRGFFGRLWAAEVKSNTPLPTFAWPRRRNETDRTPTVNP